VGSYAQTTIWEETVGKEKRRVAHSQDGKGGAVLNDLYRLSSRNV